MPACRHLFLVVVDGLRPDALGRGFTPEIERLAAEGAFCPAAQAVVPSISLPCHVSMFCGVPPERHGVLTNTWLPPQPPIPSLLDVAHRAGLRTAALYTWEELRDLSRPGSLDYCHFRRRDPARAEEGELELGAAAADEFGRHRPRLTFVYFGAADEAGHDHGWMSGAYLSAVAAADTGIGQLRRAVDQSGCTGATAFLVLADHGGHALDHAEGTPEDTTIPWIASGAGCRRGVRLGRAVSIVDTAPTAAHLLGLPAPAAWSGRPVAEALA